MPSGRSISFRSQLVSNSLDLIQEIGWPPCGHTSQLIAAIVSQLAAYTEEGVAMTPSVFLCDSIANLQKRAGVGEFVPLSGDLPLATAGPQILKAAAPLCRDNWRIYVERLNNGEKCRFGVFCGSSDPSSLEVDEVVFADDGDGFPIVRVAQSAVNKVEVRTSAGKGIEFRFNNDIDVADLNSHSHMVGLAKAIAADSGLLSEKFESFITRLLSTAIRNSHGTLVAVIPHTQAKIPESLEDAVQLSMPLDLYARFKLHFDEGRTAVSVSRLQAAVELISGFIGSDGITVFDSAGKVLCYRAFIKSNVNMPSSEGGARTRAYHAMRDLVGTDLNAAFFRSQDGRTDFVMKGNAK